MDAGPSPALRRRMYATVALFGIFGVSLVGALYLLYARAVPAMIAWWSRRYDLSPGLAWFAMGVMGITLLTLAAKTLANFYVSPLSETNAEPIDREEFPDLYALVERLAARADVPAPSLAMVYSDVPNAYTAGFSPEDSTIVVTACLVEGLEPEELEAVLAHEIAHVANRDAAVMSVGYLLPAVSFAIASGLVSFVGGTDQPADREAFEAAHDYEVLRSGWGPSEEASRAEFESQFESVFGESDGTGATPAPAGTTPSATATGSPGTEAQPAGGDVGADDPRGTSGDGTGDDGGGAGRERDGAERDAESTGSGGDGTGSSGEETTDDGARERFQHQFEAVAHGDGADGDGPARRAPAYSSWQAAYEAEARSSPFESDGQDESSDYHGGFVGAVGDVDFDGGGGSGRGKVIGILVLIAMVVLTAVLTMAISLVFWVFTGLTLVLLARTREYAADRTAVELTGDPAALGSALQRVDATLREAPATDLRAIDGAVETLYFAPLNRGSLGRREAPVLSTDLFPNTHPPTEARLERIRSLVTADEPDSGT